MALSIAEAEYVAACSASCEPVWIRKLLYDLFDLQLDIFRQPELCEVVREPGVP